MARTRSPNYPVVDLGTAVDLATRLEKYAQRHPVPAEAAVEKAWGMKGGGSYGAQCIAALRQFGLVQEEDKASKRHIRLTEDAAKIVHNHPERVHILRALAYKPKIHATLAAHFPDGLPPDDTIRTYLLFDHQPPFNPATVNEFISQLRKTVAYADIDLPLRKEENTGVMPPNPERNPQLPVVETPPAVKRPPLTTGMTQAVFPLDEGDALLQMPNQFSEESYEEFEAWLQLVLKKAKRSVVSKSTPPPTNADDLV